MTNEIANPIRTLVSLVTVERIRNELDLAGPQMANLKESIDELKDDLMGKVQELQKKSEAEKEKLRPELMQRMGDELDELLSKVMRPDQLKRYKQLKLQKDGLAAFTDSAVRNEIDFSEEQKKELLPVLGSGIKKVNAARRNGTDVRGRTVKEVEQEELIKITDLMSETQVAKWQELRGSDFDFGEEPVTGVPSKGPGGAGGPGRQGPGGAGPAAPNKP